MEGNRDHDRHFLNSVCTHIADIDYETIITYTGGYDDMVMKTQVRTQIESQNAQREKKISQLNELSRGLRPARDRASAVAAEGSRALAGHGTGAVEYSTSVHQVRAEAASGKHILRESGQFTATKRWCASLRRAAARRKNRPDGATALGRRRWSCAAGDSPTVPESELRQTSGYDGNFVDTGKVSWGHEAAVGYFAQDHKGLIQPGMTVFSGCTSGIRRRREEIRGLLGQMLFAREDGNKKTDVLSGGEAARVIFASSCCRSQRSGARRPTGHLDLESINALNIALQRYQNVVIGDACYDLIDEVATRIWHFETTIDHGDFKGSYEEYQTVHA
jgi:ATPase subunit of ABC transporter with duplicated ATPase domains